MTNKKSDIDIDAPKLTIEIALDNDDPTHLHSFLSELPAWGHVGGWENFNAVITEGDGTARDAKLEAYRGEDPIEHDG